MKKLIQIIFCFLISLPAMIAVPVDGVENVHLKDRTRFVTDGAGVMSARGVAPGRFDACRYMGTVVG